MISDMNETCIVRRARSGKAVRALAGAAVGLLLSATPVLADGSLSDVFVVNTKTGAVIGTFAETVPGYSETSLGSPVEDAVPTGGLYLGGARALAALAAEHGSDADQDGSLDGDELSGLVVNVLAVETGKARGIDARAVHAPDGNPANGEPVTALDLSRSEGRGLSRAVTAAERSGNDALASAIQSLNESLESGGGGSAGGGGSDGGSGGGAGGGASSGNSGDGL